LSGFATGGGENAATLSPARLTLCAAKLAVRAATIRAILRIAGEDSMDSSPKKPFSMLYRHHLNGVKANDLQGVLRPGPQCKEAINRALLAVAQKLPDGAHLMCGRAPGM
jgi:hypothetical protein